MKNPIKIDHLGVPLFLETPLFIGFLRVPGCLRGEGNWGTLRIPFGKLGEPYGGLGKIRGITSTP